MVVDDQPLAAGDETVVDVDVDRLADLAVELDDGAAAQPQQLVDRHRRLAQDRRELDGDVVDGAEPLGTLAAARGIAQLADDTRVVLALHVVLGGQVAAHGGLSPSSCASVAAEAAARASRSWSSAAPRPRSASPQPFSQATRTMPSGIVGSHSSR